MNDMLKNDRGVQMRDPRDEIFVQERPWGQFEQFVSNERVTVKIITVQPGHRLSLQTHDNRGEFWQVLDGPIEVTVGWNDSAPRRTQRRALGLAPCVGARGTSAAAWSRWWPR